MHRLTEILAFPKAWYKRSLVRRVFLGDMSTGMLGEETKDSSSSSPTLFAKTSTSRRNSLSYGITGGPRVSLRAGEADSLKRRETGALSSSRTGNCGEHVPSAATSSRASVPSWETLVLFTVNFTKLNVQMNMGNVMGNVSWIIRDAKSEGRLSIGSTGHKNLYIGVGLNSSYIEAKAGIVAGTFELTQLNTYVRAQEDPGVEPHHTVRLKMYGLELRLDFMGTSVLMGRVSGLEIKLKDELQVQRERTHHTYSEEDVLAMIFIHGDMGWDQLQLMIFKSTTVDLLKMHCKLDEFFSQQFKSSKWVLWSMHHEQSGGQATQASLTPTIGRRAVGRHHHLGEEGGNKTYPLTQHQHHRHWQQVLEKVSLMSISSMMLPLPEAGTALGGTMDLHGNNISLACFHGVNFKAKSWALFSLKEPFISFSTEAQETTQPEVLPLPNASCSSPCCVSVIQNLNFSLGQQNTHAMSINSVQHESMAMVCRITRNVMFPPQFRTLHEWFHYAFAPSEIDDVARFPSLERERERAERERADSGGSERRTPGRLHDPNHNREVIFALPSLELFFKTEHMQTCSLLDVNTGGGKPLVHCSFITEFEKEKLVSAQLAAGRSQSPSVRMTESESGFGHSPSTPPHTGSTSTLSEKNGRRGSSTDVDVAAGRSTGGKIDGIHSIPISKPSTNVRLGSVSPSPGTTSCSSIGLEQELGLGRDWRDYNCKTWQLEPTVRLLSWAGKSIEPYGVDYILQKLGFSHARITIPKWMQRGFFDPLDKVLSVLIFRMIDLARREGTTASHHHHP
ncbi:unnamed protein product [Orchesella dallaii]|uniref:Bridge-like lipid transfer protein family member 1 C-terminal domain-containing protein n=1 Tax=Orchesella dallaii TaxID=48710 RepID=A0ABP1RKF6_9HEXA